ncbi:MAG TPA: MFS transporter, partial [Longimicrobiales bacterium]|nr:MFS transporter [Longimicrobiales bacterium]
MTAEGAPRLRHAVREYGITAGTLGSTAGQTMMVVLLPLLLSRYTDSAALIGFAVGGEGIVAVLVPYWIGAWSDHLPRAVAERFGRRTFFLLLTAPIMAAAVGIAPFLEGFWPIALAALVFFLALHGYLAPLWALMVDEVPASRHGRVQGVRGALHSVGLAFGLVAGGLLFALWEPLPFLTAAGLILAMTAITYFSSPRTWTPGHEGDRPELLRLWRRLRGRPAVSWMLTANIVGVQADADVLAVANVLANPLYLVGKHVGRGHLHRGRQVDNDRLALVRTPDVGDGINHFRGKVQLGTREALR